MTFWIPSLPKPFNFSLRAPPPEPAPPPSEAGPVPATPRRFPPPPNRGSDAAITSFSAEGWVPRSSSSTSLSTPITSQMAILDTPSSYHPSATRRSQSPESLRRPIDSVDSPSDDYRPNKKRRGLAGSVLSKALDVAIFSTALSYSAYQLWRHPPGEGERDGEEGNEIEGILRERQLRITNGTPREGDLSPPPTYEDATNVQPSLPKAVARARKSHSSRTTTGSGSPSTPSQIPRRVRHIHERSRPSPRPSSSSSSFTTPPFQSEPVASTSALPPPPQPQSTQPYDPFSPSHLLPHPLPEFHPDSDDDEESDEEMKLVGARLKELIENGTNALRSRPVWNSGGQEMDRGTGSLPLPLPGPTSTPGKGHQRRQSTPSFPLPLSPRPSHSARKSISSIPVPLSPRKSQGGTPKLRSPRKSDNAEALEGVLEETSALGVGMGRRGSRKGWWEEDGQ